MTKTYLWCKHLGEFVDSPGGQTAAGVRLRHVGELRLVLCQLDQVLAGQVRRPSDDSLLDGPGLGGWVILVIKPCGWGREAV